MRNMFGEISITWMSYTGITPQCTLLWSSCSTQCHWRDWGGDFLSDIFVSSFWGKQWRLYLALLLRCLQFSRYVWRTVLGTEIYLLGVFELSRDDCTWHWYAGVCSFLGSFSKISFNHAASCVFKFHRKQSLGWRRISSCWKCTDYLFLWRVFLAQETGCIYPDTAAGFYHVCPMLSKHNELTSFCNQ